MAGKFLAKGGLPQFSLQADRKNALGGSFPETGCRQPWTAGFGEKVPNWARSRNTGPAVPASHAGDAANRGFFFCKGCQPPVV